MTTEEQVKTFIDNLYKACPKERLEEGLEVEHIGFMLATRDPMLAQGIAGYYLKKDFTERYEKENHSN